MKQPILVLLTLFGFLLLFSCKNDSTNSTESPESTDTQEVAKNTDYDKMAAELCKCLSPLADMQTKVTALVEAGKTEELTQMMPEVEKVTKEGEACVQALEATYGKVSGEEEKKADAAFKKACPELASMLSTE